MNIEQALFKSRALRVTGWAFLIAGALFYFTALLLYLYSHAMQMAQHPFLWPLARMIQVSVAAIYQATRPYIEFFWSHAPQLRPDDPFSYSNLFFLGLVGLMIIGKQLGRSGKYLRRRVDQHLERLDEYQWRDAHLSSLGVGAGSRHQKVSTTSVAERDWWQEPWGVVGLSIVSGYAVAVLAKITGMV